MKFSVLISLVILLSSCSQTQAQSKHSGKDSLTKGAVLNYATDSTGLLSIKDMQELANLLQELPAKYANPITQWLQARLQLRAQEYATKPRHLTVLP